MGSGFTKLFGSLITSSVWCEDNNVLRVWIAMLAMCDAAGIVEGSIPGLASICRMPIPELQAALERLLSPDPYSRTPDHEGRRIEPIPGGWRILNYLAYREKGQAKEGSRAEYFRRYRAAARAASAPEGDPQHATVARNTEAEAEADKKNTPLPPKGRRKRRTRNPFPLETCGDLDAEEAFNHVVQVWPLVVRGWDNRERREVEVRPSRGNLTVAQQHFAELIKDGHATAYELYLCAWIAVDRWTKANHIYIPHISTFFGPQKEIWAEYITEARAMKSRLDSTDDH